MQDDQFYQNKFIQQPSYPDMTFIQQQPRDNQRQPGRDSRPPIRDNQPPIRDNRPPIRDNQPPIRDNRPPIRDNRPPIRDNRPPIRDNRPPIRDNRPPIRDNRPPIRDNRPPIRDNQPPIRDNRPPFAPPAGGIPRPSAPRSAPPSFSPRIPDRQGGARGMRNCLNRNTFIWLDNGNSFWFFPTFVGRQAVIGFSWRGFGWILQRINLERVRSFQCF